MKHTIRLSLFTLCMLLAVTSAAQSERGLKDAYQDYFRVGVSINARNLSTEQQRALIIQEFNSLTCENEMKPASVHPKEGVWNWEQADRIANFCRQNGIKMRGHCLCWHAQFCDWMFTDKDGKPVTKKVFYKRLREHIHAVVNRYKDVVYCWDVVNEAINDGDKWKDGTPCPYRKTRQYELCGDEFIAKAFKFAHEADPKAQLFYNDYSAVEPGKCERIYQMVKKMKDAGVPIHGIGMQGHYNIYWPSADLVDKAIKRYSELVDIIHVTELDVRANREMGGQLQFSQGSGNIDDEVKRRQDEQYASLFRVFRQHKDLVKCVTFWNLNDGTSWLGKQNYPLLFDEQFNRKSCYFGVRDFNPTLDTQ